jgi:hypothetical protein
MANKLSERMAGSLICVVEAPNTECNSGVNITARWIRVISGVDGNDDLGIVELG